MTTPKSSCCSAPMNVEGLDGETRHYGCTECEKPTDPKPEADKIAQPPMYPVCHCGELMKDHTEFTYAGYPAIEIEMEEDNEYCPCGERYEVTHHHDL